MPTRDQSLQLAFGLNKQTAVGTPSSTFATFLKVDHNIPYLKYGTETDAKEIGKPNEFAQNVYPTAYDFAPGAIEKYASAEFTCWAWAYALGNVAYATGLYTILPEDPATSLELPYFSHAAKLLEGGGTAMDELYLDCAMEDVVTTFEYGPGRKSAQTKCSFMGTGNNTIPSGITYPTSALSENYMLSSSMSISVNGVDYVAGTPGAKSILKGSIGWKNNLIAPLRYFPGSGLLNNAAIGGRILYGDRVPTLNFSAFFLSTSTEYAKLIAQTSGTAMLTLTHDATHFVTWDFGKVIFTSVERKTEEGLVAVDVMCEPMYTSGGGLGGLLTVTSKNPLTTIAQ